MDKVIIWSIVISCKIIIFIIFLLCRKRYKARHPAGQPVQTVQPIVLPPGASYPRQDVVPATVYPSAPSQFTSTNVNSGYPSTMYAPYPPNGTMPYSTEYNSNPSNDGRQAQHSVNIPDQPGHDLPPSYDVAIKQRLL